MRKSSASIPGFDCKVARIAGVDLHYWVGGDPHAQPVILWHGFLSTGFAWRDVAPALAAAGLCVLIPDMRGYGDSGTISGPERRVEAIFLPELEKRA
jgi:pimeloyl-ACP methyl ester carboxylesterase